MIIKFTKLKCDIDETEMKYTLLLITFKNKKQNARTYKEISMYKNMVERLEYFKFIFIMYDFLSHKILHASVEIFHGGLLLF